MEIRTPKMESAARRGNFLAHFNGLVEPKMKICAISKTLKNYQLEFSVHDYECSLESL